MAFYLLVVSIIILVCLSLGRVSSRFGVPTLLVFIFLGMLFGSDGIFKIAFDNYAAAELICSISLIFIMFYGGFGTNWSHARPVAVKAVLLSSVGVALTALFTGLFCYYILDFAFLESMLIGAVISSTDAASVFSILRSKRLNLKHNTASLLEVESGSNDPCSYMLTVIILSLMGTGGGESIFLLILAQIVFGVVWGVLTALAACFVLAHFKFPNDGFDSIFVFTAALISYSGAAIIGGNGYLSAYITGIIMGNRPIPKKKSLVNFFDGITGLMQIMIFFLLGLVSFPSQLPKIFVPALAIALFLTFVSRPLAVILILTPFKCPINQQLLVSWSGLRGAASIVFSIAVMVSPNYSGHDVFHVVFFIVLFSISIQGSLIPLVAKKLNMIDENSDVMRTFSDYSDEGPVQFIKLPICKNHPWCNKKIRDIELLPNLLLASLVRGEKQIVPKGATTILEGDTVVLSGPSFEGDGFGSILELRISKGHEWLGKSLCEIKFPADELILLIKRGSRVVMPSGQTVIKEGDILIVNRSTSPQKSKKKAGILKRIG